MQLRNPNILRKSADTTGKQNHFNYCRNKKDSAEAGIV